MKFFTGFVMGVMITIYLLFCAACTLNFVIKDNEYGDISSYQTTDVQDENNTNFETNTRSVTRSTTPLPPRKIKKKRTRKRYKKSKPRHRYKNPPRKRNRTPVRKSRPKRKNTTFKKIRKKVKKCPTHIKGKRINCKRKLRRR